MACVIKDAFMVTNRSTQTLVQAENLRDQADRLLSDLLTARLGCEERLAESGRRDPIKFVTGRTALDNAILETRAMLSQMDQLLDEFRRDLDQLESPAITTIAPTPRALTRGRAQHAFSS